MLRNVGTRLDFFVSLMPAIAGDGCCPPCPHFKRFARRLHAGLFRQTFIAVYNLRGCSVASKNLERACITSFESSCCLRFVRLTLALKKKKSFQRGFFQPVNRKWYGRIQNQDGRLLISTEDASIR